MTITFSMTAGDLVPRAMQRRRCLGLGRTPTAHEMAYGLERLNLLLKPLARYEGTQWAVEDTTATITGGSGSVTLAVRPGRIVSVGLVLSATNERPLAEWEMGQYDVLPNKAAVGDPTIYVVRELVAATTLRVWPVPATNKTLNVRYVRVPEDVTQAAAVDVPQDWLEDLETLLAWRMDAFANGNPELPALGERAERTMKDRARPASYFFESDCGGCYA
jgi:hypothetical protein